MSRVIEKFLRYVAVDTQSQEGCQQVPSTEKQFQLANMLKRELEDMGASNVRLDSHCYVYATIPATAEGKRSIGFISHMDTSNAVSGKDVKARIVKKYDGGEIVLNEALGYRMGPADYPVLSSYVGCDLIVTDDSEIARFWGRMIKPGWLRSWRPPSISWSIRKFPMGRCRSDLLPTRKLGRGVDFFDVEGFGAQFAYTVDGGDAGELEYENFNAVGYRIAIRGTSIHPGSAKGKMKNALLLGMEFERMLPEFDKPAYTEGYEGFYHLTDMKGSCDGAEMEYIIRDHDAEKFDQKVAFFSRTALSFSTKSTAREPLPLQNFTPTEI